MEPNIYTSSMHVYLEVCKGTLKPKWKTKVLNTFDAHNYDDWTKFLYKHRCQTAHQTTDSSTYTDYWISYPQYFSQLVPLRMHGHVFPQLNLHVQGVYCLQGWSFESTVRFLIAGWPADFQVYLSLRTLPLLCQYRVRVRASVFCPFFQTKRSIIRNLFFMALYQ